MYGGIVVKVPFHSTYMVWVFEIDSGWFDLVLDLSSKLENILQEMPEEERRSNRACQVKERFGGLRFYLHCGTDEMGELITEAEVIIQ